MRYSLEGVFGADSRQVLWEDGERVFHRGWRVDDDGKRHAVLVVYRPPTTRPARPSTASPTNTNLGTSSTRHGRRVRWTLCASGGSLSEGAERRQPGREMANTSPCWIAAWNRIIGETLPIYVFGGHVGPT